VSRLQVTMPSFASLILWLLMPAVLVLSEVAAQPQEE